MADPQLSTPFPFGTHQRSTFGVTTTPTPAIDTRLIQSLVEQYAGPLVSALRNEINTLTQQLTNVTERLDATEKRYLDLLQRTEKTERDLNGTIQMANQVETRLSSNLTIINDALKNIGAPTTMDYKGGLMTRLETLESRTTEHELTITNWKEHLEGSNPARQSSIDGIDMDMDVVFPDMNRTKERLDKQESGIKTLQNAYTTVLTRVQAEEQIRTSENGDLVTILRNLNQKLNQLHLSESETPTLVPCETSMPTPSRGHTIQRPHHRRHRRHCRSLVVHAVRWNGCEDHDPFPRRLSRPRQSRTPGAEAASKLPKPALPTKWTGGMECLDVFLLSMQLFLDHPYWGALPESAKIATALTFIGSDRTIGFMKDIISRRVVYLTFAAFTEDLVRKFGDPHIQAKRLQELEELQQGKKSVIEYTRKFNELCSFIPYDRGASTTLEKYKQGLARKWFNLLRVRNPRPTTLDQWQFQAEVAEIRDEEDRRLRLAATRRFAPISSSTRKSRV